MCISTPIHVIKRYDGQSLIDLCLKRKWDELRNYLKYSNEQELQMKKEMLLWKNKGHHNGRGCFHYACYWSNVPMDIIELMVEIGGQDLLNSTDNDGFTALGYAGSKILRQKFEPAHESNSLDLEEEIEFSI
ncbi:predicted protein [Chaetoceros tenuissimus]|uniref:Uncharacterized protein n=1 Tax=Chaetoceros tenuissimus TaxID=426638 RepID=A0AAD3CX97_9STRA|nr:predicted protein [Chaetoceros tenuissimus]